MYWPNFLRKPFSKNSFGYPGSIPPFQFFGGLYIYIYIYIYTYIYILWYWCCILTFDLAKHAITKTAEVTHSDGQLWEKIAVGGLGWQYGTMVKIPRYSRRLMHRKRVTCELHDSYVRLMTIIHAIPKASEVTHSDSQLWGDIQWVIELLYNLVKTGSHLVFGDQTRWWQDAVEEASSQQSGPLGLWLSNIRRTGKKHWWP